VLLAGAHMKYVALVRGINVGGKNLIRMGDLKECLERNGYESVATYIQSGNVIFESGTRDTAKLTRALEAALAASFDCQPAVVLRSHNQLETVVAEVPPEWKKRRDLRCYVAFLRQPLTARQALGKMAPREGVDSVAAGKGVVYMTTLVSRLKQSGFTKLVGTDIYRDITIRNYTTCQKILALMQRN